MKRFPFFWLALVLVVAAGVWWFSPTQVLKRRTKSFLKVISIEESTGKAGRQMRAFELSEMLAGEVVFKNPDIEELNATLDRGDIESGFSWLAHAARLTDFKASEFRTITRDGETAQVEFTAEALVEMRDYRPADGRYDVTFTWKKEKNDWKLTSADWTEKR